MLYTRIFDPPFIQSLPENGHPTTPLPGGDRRDGLVYVYTEEIILAVNIALVTGRPLLIRGPSGSGKSTLALNVARSKDWRYYEEVISSRTQARDLQWQFDALRRLSDAQVKKLQPTVTYVKPGILWRAFDPEGADKWERRARNKDITEPPNIDHSMFNKRAVVLLDEIDKADPDVPNNLLVPLGSYQFEVQETEVETKVEAKKGVDLPLIIITTNDERSLPSAFWRRCVILELKHPDKQRLIEIAKVHFGPDHKSLYENVADLVIEARYATLPRGQIVPSAAEFLDAVRACRDLNVTPDPEDKTWKVLSQSILQKPRDAQGGV